MKKLFVVVLFLLLPGFAIAQECNCLNNSAVKTNGKWIQSSLPLRIFSFTKNWKMMLCGSITVEKKDTTFSEFGLYRCGEAKPLKDWDATQSCKVKVINDTLLVSELYGMPIGKNFKELWLPFYTQKIFVVNGKLKEKEFYRNDIKKYSKEQRAQVIAKYKGLTRGNDEHTVEVANMLFWGNVSGSKQCEVYLNQIDKKFGPFDGAIAEEWEDIRATYEHWKEKNKHR